MLTSARFIGNYNEGHVIKGVMFVMICKMCEPNLSIIKIRSSELSKYG